MFKLFTSRRFYPLFIVQFLGGFNDNAFKNAFIVWLSFGMAQQLNIDSNFYVALAPALFILPYFLFSSFAGTLADRYDKQILTQYIKLAEIIIMLAGVVAFYMQSVHALLAVLFALGMQSTFFSPIKYSLLPTHLRSNELLLGNSLIEAGTFLSILLGTIAGGLLINLNAGLKYLMVLVLTISIIGWLSSFLIPQAPPTEQGKQLKINWNIATGTYQLVKETFSNFLLKQIICTMAWFYFIASLFMIKLPSYVSSHLLGNEGVLTVFLALFSIGIGLGATLCHTFSKGRISWTVMATGFVGLTICIVAFLLISYYFLPFANINSSLNSMSDLMTQPTLWLLMLVFLCIALFAGMFIVPLTTALQEQTPKRQLGRAIATHNVINALAMVMTSIIAIALSALKLPLLTNFLILAIINLLLIVRVLIKKPAFMSIRSKDELSKQSNANNTKSIQNDLNAH